MRKYNFKAIFVLLALVFVVGMVWMSGSLSHLYDTGTKGTGSSQPTGKDIPNTNVEEPDETDPSDNKPAEPGQIDTDTLKTDRLSWWYKSNKQHETPEIPNSVAKIINRFAGIYVGDTSRKVVYLTFDEGYENGYTSSILNTLKANNISASFFVTGSYIDKNPELVCRMVDEGHDVCSHTSTHPSLPSISDARLKQEIKNTEDKFRSVTGREIAHYLRPPMGEYSEKSLYLTQKLGYVSVFWSMAYKDWDVNDQKGADYAYNFVMNNVHPGAIILLHAVSSSNAEALDRIIKGLIDNGYTFARLP